MTHDAEGWIDAAQQGCPADRMWDLFPWAQTMDECLHDAVYHAEGSPWVHTCMVVQALEESSPFQAMPEDRKAVLRLAGWLHDVAKPKTTVEEICSDTGRTIIRQPGHAPLGAKIAWQTLIDADVPVSIARDVHALVAWHMRPSHMDSLHDDKLLRQAVRYSHEAGNGNWRELLCLCHADQDGRICETVSKADQHLPLDLVTLRLAEMEEAFDRSILHGPWDFQHDASRLLALSKPGASPWHDGQAATGSHVTIMSGLPGSGKDTWLVENAPDLPVISLDDLRLKMGVRPGENQGQVVQAAVELARGHLRQGTDFAWNATNLSRLARQKISSLALDYDAHVEFVSIDVPIDVAIHRNRNRETMIPEQALRDMALKREPVGPAEAHALLSVDADGRLSSVFGASSLMREPTWNVECAP